MLSQVLAVSDFSDAIQLCKTFGPCFLAVVFFLWRDWKREDRLSKRINVLEDEQRKVIIPLVKECTAVVTKNTAVMDRNSTIMERLEKVLQFQNE